MSKIEIVKERIKIYEEKIKKDEENVRELESEYVDMCNKEGGSKGVDMGDGKGSKKDSKGECKDKREDSKGRDMGINKDDLNTNLSLNTSLNTTPSFDLNKKSSLLMDLNHLISLLKSKEKEIFGDLFRDSSYDEYKRLTSPEKSLEFKNLKGKLKSKIRILEGEIEDLEEQRDDFLKEKNKIDLKIKDLNPEIDTEIMKYDFLLEKKKGELEGALKDFNLINENYKEKINLKKKLDLDFINLELNKNKLEEELEEKIRFGELEEIEYCNDEGEEGDDDVGGSKVEGEDVYEGEDGSKEKNGSKVGYNSNLNEDDPLSNLNSLNLTKNLPISIPPPHHTPLDILISNLNKINSQISELVPSIKHSKKSQNYEKILKNYEEAKKKAMDSRKKMNEIKRERSSIFMKCFEIVSSEIGKIYQEISKNEFTKGNAYLVLDNPTEPYLEGIRYHVMPPTKRFREIGHLSGGEKSMAILALMFSINKFMPVPFFILDEFDSALDNTNVGRMVDFFIKCNVQFLVISLKPILFQYADSLVGVYQDPNEKSSKILTYRV